MLSGRETVSFRTVLWKVTREKGRGKERRVRSRSCASSDLNERKDKPEGFGIQSRDVLDRTKKLALEKLKSLENWFGDGDESADGSVDAS